MCIIAGSVNFYEIKKYMRILVVLWLLLMQTAKVHVLVNNTLEFITAFL
jgi:hypothetical protein